MHHTLPFPATKIKCILALANEDGMRGGTLPREAAEDELREGWFDAAPLQSEIQGIAHVSFGIGPPVVSIHNTRAYGGRGGSKVNAVKKKVYWERKLGDAYLP